MSEQTRVLVAYVTFHCKDGYWKLEPRARADALRSLCESVEKSGKRVSMYQIFPARCEYDFFAWLTIDCDTCESPDQFFGTFARAFTRHRIHFECPLTLVGITKPSMYVRPHENPQEIKPFDDDRKPYFVIYPFAKTCDWYLKSKEDRQQMMAGHIRLGKTYPAIKQLLLYSFGIQDQEFIVAYEMDDLPMFSDLVQDLRSTEARAYTLLDTPIIAGMLRTPEQLVDIFGSGD
jgi:chlorite dismutase